MTEKETNSNPKLSIITPLYNHENYISEFLAVFLGDDNPGLNCELVIIDDCSTDNSFRVAQEHLQKSPIEYKLLKNEVNRGVAYTLNKGIKESIGNYILTVASDDILDLHSVKQRLSYLSANTAVHASIGECHIIDRQGRIIKKNALKTLFETKKNVKPTSNGYQSFLTKYWGLQGGMLILRREVFVEVGYFNTNLIHEDWEFFLRLSSRYDISFDFTPSLRYRLHEQNFHKKRKFKATIEHLLVTVNYVVKSNKMRPELVYRCLTLLLALCLLPFEALRKG